MDGEFEADLHGEGVDLGFGQRGEFGGGGVALGAEGAGGGAVSGGGGGELGAQGLEDFVAVFNLGELAGHVFGEGDDLGDGLAVLALEAVQKREAVFDLGEALGACVDSFGVVAEAGAEVADGGAGGGKLLRRLSEAGVVAGQLLDVAQGGAEGGLGGTAAFVKLVKRVCRGGVELFGVGEDALFGFESLVFAGDEVGGFDLLLLVAPEIDHAEAVLLTLEEVVEFFLGGTPAGVGFGDGGGVDAGEAVEENALLGLVEARQALALGMDQGQLGGKLAQHGNRGRLIVDEDAALAAGGDLAAQNDVVTARIDAVFFQDVFGVGGGLEDAGDDGLLGAVADDLGGGFAAHQQGQSIDEDGFSRAGFAGEQVQAGAEGGDGVIDDGVVFSAEFDKHGVVRTPGFIRPFLKGARAV